MNYTSREEAVRDISAKLAELELAQENAFLALHKDNGKTYTLCLYPWREEQDGNIFTRKRMAVLVPNDQISTLTTEDKLPKSFPSTLIVLSVKVDNTER